MFVQTAQQTNKPFIALFGALIMVNLMMQGGENAPVYIIGRSLAGATGESWIYFASYLGALGSFFSGSNTVSNTLFSSLQFETATILAMPQVFIVALQNNGGAIGNMVCVNNVVSACATTGTIGNEGKIIRTNIVPCIIYCAIVVIVLGGAMLMGINPVPLNG